VGRKERVERDRISIHHHETDMWFGKGSENAFKHTQVLKAVMIPYS
jgi:hypothetical protein